MKIPTKSQLCRQLIAAAAVLGTSTAIMAPAHAGTPNPNLNSTATSVQMFRWKWRDIGKECTNYLGPNGYGAVQVSPPSASRRMDGWWSDVYQPTDYTSFQSNMGSEQEFKDMVTACHKARVRVYADVVLNHMAKESGYGTDGAWYDGANLNYAHVKSTYFHGYCEINPGDYAWDRDRVTGCRLDKLPDLDTSNKDVRILLRDYINTLHNFGVDGIRIDAAKHMTPADIAGFLTGVYRDTLMDEDIWITQEVIGDDATKASDYTGNGTVNEFKYVSAMKEMFRKENGKNISQAYQILHDNSWNMVGSDQATVFVNNWDTERGGDTGPTSLVASNRSYGVTNDTDGTFRYNLANILMLGWNYGHAQVHSGYNYTDKNAGPPSDSPFDYNDAAIMNHGEKWDFIHRWTEISNMVFFRAVTSGQGVENFVMGDSYDQIAFSRGKMGFVALNNDTSKEYKKTVYTGLTKGTYCNVVHGKKNDQYNYCESDSVYVDDYGNANITIGANNSSTQSVPAIALHVNQKIN